ncbi:vWA domain-containing protein, partial [Sulfuricurvum sp.]|uniref:vWA domain-containing protein n=1 Tax=Sulfuricurvum sp. TaxID=2025608 RepID=UPI002639DA83
DNNANNTNETVSLSNFTITGTQNAVTYTPLDTVVDSFVYTVTDTNGTDYLANLDITIHDDSPVVNDTTAISISLPPETDTNILLTLDVSGSMSAAYGGTVTYTDQNGNTVTTTRFELAKQALIDTINAYDANGNIKVNLSLFNSTAITALNWVDATTAKNYINALSMNSNGQITYNGNTITGLTSVNTNYEAALNETIKADDNGIPVADQTVAYFISDGAPTVENNEGNDVNGNVGTDAETGWLDTPYVNNWTNFIAANNINLTVIGIGSNLNTDYLNLVQVEDGKTAIVVTNVEELSNTITSNIESVTGSLYGSDGQAGINFGADSGHILQLSYNGTTYIYDQANPTQDITLSEGMMALNFETGKFTYTPTSTSGLDITENFIISVTDADGDSTLDKPLSLVIGIDESFTFTGTAIDGHAGMDTLILQSNANIDFSALANDVIKNIEVLDLAQNGNHNLTNLSYADVIDMTDSNNTLKILGDSTSDKVQLTQADGWTNTGTVTESGHTFDIYMSHGINATDPTVTVKVEQIIDNSVS